MKTIEEIQNTVTGPSVLTHLTDLLRTRDNSFPKVEAAYREAVETLEAILPPQLSPILNKYIAAHETDIISQMVCAGYLGYRVNIENFRHPIGIDFVRLDPVDHTKSQIIGGFPVNCQSEAVIRTFLCKIPKDYESHCEKIEQYFVFLECTGPKLAHYAGYIIANHLLPWMEPGYRPDQIQTSQFSMSTLDYLGFLPL